MQLLSLLVEILKSAWEWIYIFSPFKIIVIYEGESGVKFKKGKIINLLDPGIHFGAFLEVLKKDKSVYCKGAIDYELDFLLKDYVPIKINIVYTYNIEDYGLFLTSSEESSYLLSDIVETSAQKVIAAKTFEEFHCNRNGTDNEIIELVQSTCNSAFLGVDMKMVRINTIKITSNLLSNVVGLPRVFDGIKDYVDEGYDFGAISAIISSANPINSIKINEFEESEED